MCTLTWAHHTSDRPVAGPVTNLGSEAGVATRDGYRLWFNRDEMRSRGPEVPPRVEQARGGLNYIAPSDSDAGGTWIAVNELGITVCLLNGSRAPRAPDREEWTSRGHLVRELAGARNHAEVWRRMAPSQLSPFRPLVLAVIAPGRPALIVRWDGKDAVLDPRGELQLPIISSSDQQSEVDRSRRQRFREMVRTDARSGEPVDPAELEAYQSWTPLGGPDAFSPSMSRPDAGTRSQCMVAVGPDEVQLRYTAGPPHCTPPGPTVCLPRQAQARGRR